MFYVYLSRKEAGLNLTLHLYEGCAKNNFNFEKMDFDINWHELTKDFPFRDIYLSSKKKMFKFCCFVSSQAPIPHSDMIFMEQ